MVAEAFTDRFPDALRLTKLVMAEIASGRCRPSCVSCPRSRLKGRASATLNGMSRSKSRTPVLVLYESRLWETRTLVSATSRERGELGDENLPVKLTV